MPEEPSPVVPDSPLRNRRPFSLKRLLYWQFTLGPVFLMPLTVRQSYDLNRQPLAQLVTQVIFPVTYVAVLMWIHRPQAEGAVSSRASRITAGIYRGIGYALLMAFLSWGWSLYLPVRRLFDLVSTGLLFVAFGDLFIPTLTLPTFVGLHYALIGAVTGCALSLVTARRELMEDA